MQLFLLLNPQDEKKVDYFMVLALHNLIIIKIFIFFLLLNIIKVLQL